MVIERKVGNPHAGIVAYLIDRLLLGGTFNPDTRQVPDTGMGRGNNRALDEIVDAVADDPLALGYAGFANRRPNTKTVALAESAGQRAYAGTEEEVTARVYPLTRTIFIFARPDCSPAAREFLRFVLSREGQADVKKDPAGFLPLPDQFCAGERRKLD
jgi:phosphate transport system substrate-binding protein